MSLSKINSRINLEYLAKEKENLYFDRKRAKISIQELANEIASFANSNGGLIAVGITDDGKIEGFNPYGKDKLNEFQKVVTNYLKNTPNYKTELIDIKNEKGENDNILIFHVEPELNYVIRNNNEITQEYLSCSLLFRAVHSLKWNILNWNVVNKRFI